MREVTVEQRLRRFLLVVAGAVLIGTLVELWFTEHTETAIQWVPFVLSGLGLVAIAAMLVSPTRRVLVGLRVVTAIVALGGVYGIYEHLVGNVAFEREIQPAMSAGEAFWEGLSGANPLLAPGIMVLAASLAIAATYRHPALEASRPA